MTAQTPLAEAWPDPIVTANIYCSGKLDELIHGAISPFLRFHREHDPASRAYLWVIRHGRRGEHLKVRLHGPPAERTSLKRRFSEAVEAFLQRIAPLVDQTPRRYNADPPIDVEDEIDEYASDRTLLWTTYRRSHVSLGSRPFHRHDTYTTLLTRALGFGTQRVLEQFQPEADGCFSFSVRQRSLVKVVISGLAALDSSGNEQRSYLSFHRDWLIRSSVGLKAIEKQHSLRELFDRRCDSMEESRRCFYDAFVQAREAATLSEDQKSERLDIAWQRSIRELRQDVESRVIEPEYCTDPYATNPVFPPFFKLFHGLANQLGIRMLDESFVYHLLCTSLPTEEATASAAEGSGG